MSRKWPGGSTPGHFLEQGLRRSAADGEQTFEAGDAYYVPPGHTPVGHAGSEVIEFSPTRELQQTVEVVSKNMQAANV